MTEETAKTLISALNRLATLLERVTSPGGYGIHIYLRQVQPFTSQPWTEPASCRIHLRAAISP